MADRPGVGSLRRRTKRSTVCLMPCAAATRSSCRPVAVLTPEQRGKGAKTSCASVRAREGRKRIARQMRQRSLALIRPERIPSPTRLNEIERRKGEPEERND
jgi:hypothetical protein